MRSAGTEPNQADFALITINDSEDQAVREVFSKEWSADQRIAGERGIFAWWLMPGGAPSDRFVVVHASTGDAKGPLPAIELIRELDLRFKPRFLLILGTAGGIAERGIEYGRVIYSRQVHAGYQQLLDRPEKSGKKGSVEVRLYDDPVQPPSDRLYLHAKKAAIGWKPSPLMERLADEAKQAIKTRLVSEASGGPGKVLTRWAEHILERIEQTKTETPEATEIFSGPYLVDGQKSELFSSLKETFPKVGAIEMEAGAVAQAVLHSIQTERFVGYLVIKGISDVVDSDVPAHERKAVRKSLATFASVASVEFAKRMITTWEGDTARPYGDVALLPPRYSSFLNQELRSVRRSNSLVYDGISLDRYSQLLDRLFSREQNIASAWTFCYLAPYRFFAAVDEDPSGDYSLKVAQETLERYKADKKELQDRLLQKFPHFQVFSDHSSSKKCEVTRIMHGGNRWPEENQEFLPHFACVNLGIKCHVLNDRDLDGEDWPRSDQLVVNEELLFDFDKDLKRLVVTYLDPKELGADFKRFKEHCDRKCKAENSYDYLASRAVGANGASAGANPKTV